jgi:hypothetical protein
MLINFQLASLATALLLLTACGAESTGDTDSGGGNPILDQDSLPPVDNEEPPKEITPDVSLHGLSPVNSTNLEGIWIGTTDYTERDSFPDYYLSYEGNRTFIIKLEKRGQSIDGTQTYFDVANCFGNEKSATFKHDENSAIVLGRSLDVQTFNVMTGTSTIAEHGDDNSGDEDWTWVKISNSTADIGQVVTSVNLLRDTVVDPAPVTHSLKSFCRDTYTKTPVGRNFAAETLSLDELGFVNNGNYIFASYEGGYMDSYLGPELNHFGYVDSDEETMSVSVANATLPEYSATYYVSGSNYQDNNFSKGAYDMNAKISVVIPSP